MQRRLLSATAIIAALPMVIYSAHWHHLGVSLPDARGDRIFNGAVDYATGIAALIELARTYAHAPRTNRSVVFLAVTAEEKGLLGSEYYAAHPLYPVATTVADLNMDALNPDGAARDVSTSGSGKVDLEDRLGADAREEGRRFQPAWSRRRFTSTAQITSPSPRWASPACRWGPVKTSISAARRPPGARGRLRRPPLPPARRRVELQLGPARRGH